MSETNVEAWLSQETDDLLDVGPFGLYELIWRLNGGPYGVVPQEAQQLSQRIVHNILEAGRAQIFAVQWPSFSIVSGPLPESVLADPASWSEGETGPLIALIPIEDIDYYRSKPQPR
jgi:hypothetical protein